MATTTINIIKAISSPFAASTEMGETLFREIEAEFNKENSVILDFTGIQLVVSTFLNAGIGQLYGVFSTDFIRDHLRIENMNNDDARLLKLVTDRAKEYFKEKGPIKDIIKNYFGADDQN